jgi:predicted DsbA family dithiol-disulfide isomerase
VRIDIWSDVVCPWCYLGHRRFTIALGRLDGIEVDVRWRAFELDPSAPREPQDLAAVLERKYGPGAHAAMTQRLTALGAAEGIEYRFDRTQRVNTFDAHRLIAWSASQEHGQDPVVEALFRAYFTDGADVGDHETLVRIVEGVGGDGAAASAALADGAFADQVRADEAEARELEVHGVPAFLLAQQLMIPGAQEVDTLVDALTRASQRLN